MKCLLVNGRFRWKSLWRTSYYIDFSLILWLHYWTYLFRYWRWLYRNVSKSF